MANIFTKAAKSAFKIAKGLGVVINVNFKSVYDDGFDDVITTTTTVEAIRESFSQEDVRGLIFRDKIQPTDIKLMILGSKVSNIDTDDVIEIDGIDYTVFGCEIDSAGAVWTVGVR